MLPWKMVPKLEELATMALEYVEPRKAKFYLDMERIEVMQEIGNLLIAEDFCRWLTLVESGCYAIKKDARIQLWKLACCTFIEEELETQLEEPETVMVPTELLIGSG